MIGHSSERTTLRGGCDETRSRDRPSMTSVGQCISGYHRDSLPGDEIRRRVRWHGHAVTSTSTGLGACPLPSIFCAILDRPSYNCEPVPVRTVKLTG